MKLDIDYATSTEIGQYVDKRYSQVNGSHNLASMNKFYESGLAEISKVFTIQANVEMLDQTPSNRSNSRGLNSSNSTNSTNSKNSTNPINPTEVNDESRFM